MTEAEWLASSDPIAMLAFLRTKISERKLRLFMCACCRRVWDQLEEHYRQAVVTAESYADRRLSRQELKNARLEISKIAYQGGDLLPGTIRMDRHAYVALCVVLEQLPFAAEQVCTDVARLQGKGNEASAQANLLRDIVGNPFRAVSLGSAWLTPKVLVLAELIYAQRAVNRMPTLANALANAGCTNGDILAHCRQPGEHVRGCWVIDLLVGKR
jgi:hypothetical protein